MTIYIDLSKTRTDKCLPGSSTPEMAELHGSSTHEINRVTPTTAKPLAKDLLINPAPDGIGKESNSTHTKHIPPGYYGAEKTTLKSFIKNDYSNAKINFESFLKKYKNKGIKLYIEREAAEDLTQETLNELSEGKPIAVIDLTSDDEEVYSLLQQDPTHDLEKQPPKKRRKLRHKFFNDLPIQTAKQTQEAYTAGVYTLKSTSPNIWHQEEEFTPPPQFTSQKQVGEIDDEDLAYWNTQTKEEGEELTL